MLPGLSCALQFREPQSPQINAKASGLATGVGNCKAQIMNGGNLAVEVGLPPGDASGVGLTGATVSDV